MTRPELCSDVWVLIASPSGDQLAFQEMRHRRFEPHTLPIVGFALALSCTSARDKAPAEPEGAPIYATSVKALSGFSANTTAGPEFSAVFAPGERRQVSVTVSNAGGGAWNSTQFMLHWVPNTTFFSWADTSIVPTVNPGDPAQVLHFSIVAPTTAGSYTFSARMFLAGTGGGFFPNAGSAVNVPITVGMATPVLGATLVSQNFPTTVAPGASFNVSVTMSNAGSATWTAGTTFLFYCRNNPTNAWGQVYAKTAADVVAGANGTFNLALKAPASGAPSTFQWQMYDTQVGFFGDLVSEQVAVTSGSADAGVPDSGSPDSGLPLDCNGVPGGTATLDDCGTCQSNPANDCTFTRYVDAVNGSDSNPGTRALRFKSITHALTTVMANQSIKVFPGTYDATNGELFPITVPANVTLWGDTVNRGAGTAPTSIDGASSAGLNLIAAILTSAGDHITGLRFQPGTAVGTYAIGNSGATTQITRNTFQSGYGGVELDGSGDPQVSDNVFDTSSYGVSVGGVTGTPLVAGNQFLAGPHLPIDIGSGAPSIQNNQIEGSGQVGIQIQNGAATIQGNVFSHTAGYQYGCFHAMGGTPTIRNNQCQNGTVKAGIYIRSGAVPDLGTTASTGGNSFIGTGVPSIVDEGTDTISAIGNTFPNNPPICGTDIVFTSTGNVVYGSGATQHCP
jgi:hypothetical protein